MIQIWIVWFHLVPSLSPLWSEWGGELSDETLSGPVLPSGPLRLLLPRLWLLSLWGCRPLSRSHLPALLQPLPALYLCQRHRYLCAHGLPANTLPPNCYQARTMLSWVHRYVTCEGSDVSADACTNFCTHKKPVVTLSSVCTLDGQEFSDGQTWSLSSNPCSTCTCQVWINHLPYPFHMSSLPCVRVLICLSLTGRRGSVCASRVPQAALYASGDWSWSLLSSLQR